MMKETYQLAKKQIKGTLSRLHYSDNGSMTYCLLGISTNNNWRRVKGDVHCWRCLKEELRRLKTNIKDNQ